ncbi:hypothetical protein GOV14_01565 [Candidatus Pacearchaeota archaeon]|nr:hypothetical protein [Candidatus Pacearchaeota archaeon]
MTKKTFKIKGMHCNSCSRLIEDSLKDKVDEINVSYSRETAQIEFNPEKISEEEIKTKIKHLGYDIEKEVGAKKSQKKVNSNNVGWIVAIASVLFFVFLIYYLFLRDLNLEIPGAGDSAGIILLFFVGILTGFHCVSMCGGFVVSYTAKNATKGHKGFKQHLIYGGSKVMSYAIIGGLFGLIGGIFAFSAKLKGYVAIFAGTFMIFYALSMMGLKFFRRFQFNPKFLTHLTTKASAKAKGPYFGPFVVGLLSGLFIACGPLQAMYLYAAGTGSFLSGSLGLAAFGLGTLPIMIGFGSLTTVISKGATKKILKLSAIIVLVLGLVMLNRGLTVMGSSITYDALKEKIIKPDTSDAIIRNGYQEINMEVNRYGWTPDSFVLKKGVPVKWNINVIGLTGCNNEIIVPSYDIDIKLKKGMQTVEFTPTKTGTIRWSCWMGMIPGSFIVTNDGAATEEQIQEVQATAPSGGSCGGSCGGSTCGAKTGGSCGCGG